jgi:hypothetical protein
MIVLWSHQAASLLSEVVEGLGRKDWSPKRVQDTVHEHADAWGDPKKAPQAFAKMLLAVLEPKK